VKILDIDIHRPSYALFLLAPHAFLRKEKKVACILKRDIASRCSRVKMHKRKCNENVCVGKRWRDVDDDDDDREIIGWKIPELKKRSFASRAENFLSSSASAQVKGKKISFLTQKLTTFDVKRLKINL
jgi:hypothetical protein